MGMIEFNIREIEDNEEEGVKIDEATKLITLHARYRTLEELFSQLDIGLHGDKTLDYFEDLCYSQLFDMEEMQSTIERYEELEEERGGK